MSGKILIVDDQDINVVLLRKILEQSGYADLRWTTDPRDAADVYMEFQPDLILLDMRMPHLDGFGVMRALRPLIPSDAYLPIIILTADTDVETRHRALAAGAKDFLTKPLDHIEVLLRIRTQLETRLLHEYSREQNVILEQQVRTRTHELEEARLETLAALARVAELRDDQTGRHTERVGRLSAALAEALDMNREQVELIHRAAPLHDLGKIGLSDDILLSPTRLTDRQREVMQTHTLVGASLLSGFSSPVLELARDIALTHHERWDGNGYPRGTPASDVALEGRIVAVADVFDALTHERPYKPAWPIEEAAAEIKRLSCVQFDPEVVDAFLDRLPVLQAAITTLPEHTEQLEISRHAS